MADWRSKPLLCEAGGVSKAVHPAGRMVGITPSALEYGREGVRRDPGCDRGRLPSCGARGQWCHLSLLHLDVKMGI